jgi:hypothetical protein
VPKRASLIEGVFSSSEIPPTGFGLRAAICHSPVAPPLAPLRISAASQTLPSSR